jgi:hypothetical protein
MRRVAGSPIYLTRAINLKESTMEYISEFWKSYANTCVPKNASSAQIKDTKMAFYAGAMSFMELFGKMVIPADDPVKAFEQLQSELMLFVHSIGVGDTNVH